MITISPFPPLLGGSSEYKRMRHHPDVEEDVYVDDLVDDEQLESVGLHAKFTSPVVPLTSSQAFMRCVCTCMH